MKVLIGCECSGIVREAFRKKGHKAYSCDIQPADDKSPWHIQGDVLEILNNNWDIAILHPPCTYLGVCANRWLDDEAVGKGKTLTGALRREAVEEGAKFFLQCYNAPVNKIALENPIGIMSTRFRKLDQIIQPYEFGHNATKKTCLWLKNLPPLIKKYYEITNEVDPHFIHNAWGMSNTERSKLRSKTFTNIALAMADQWG